MFSCIQCKTSKPVDEYYAHPQMKNGHLGVCKECHKKRMKIRSRTNPHVQQYDCARAKNPERKKKAAARTKLWRSENPEAYKAHTKVGNAIRSGAIEKLPCEFCGELNVHAHHKDYSRPLDVIWLCPKCHHRLHANFPELEGKNKANAF